MVGTGDDLTLACGTASVTLGVATIGCFIYVPDFWPVCVVLGLVAVVLLLATMHFASRRTRIVMRPGGITVSENSLFLPSKAESFAESKAVLFVAKLYGRRENILGIRWSAWSVVIMLGDRVLIPIATFRDYSSVVKARADLPPRVQQLFFDGEAVVNL
jgi:hypothetical protein